MRLLVIKLEALGDVLRTTALLAPIKAHRPEIEIWWLTSKAASGLIKGNPLVDRTLQWCPQDLDVLKTVRFDRVFCMEENPQCAALQNSLLHGMWTGVCPGGYTQDSALFYDMSLLNADSHGNCAVPDALKRANRLSYEEIWCSIAGVRPRTEPRPSLSISKAEKDRAAALLNDAYKNASGPRFAINPGAGQRWRSKRIPDNAVLELADVVFEKYATPLLLLGGPEETSEHPDLIRASNGRLRSIGTELALTQFAAVIDALDVLISTDSLALHISKAVQTPVIGVFGPTSASEVKITKGKALTAEGCRCFYRSKCSAASSCLGRLPFAQIMQTLQEFSVSPGLLAPAA